MPDGSVVDTVASCVTAAATLALAIGAIIQLPLVGKQVKELARQIDIATRAEEASDLRAREWHTIEICQKYDFDPVIEQSTIRIYEASGRGAKNYRDPAVSVRDITCVLNYLDGIAVGIRQGFYIEDIVKEHMSGIFEHAAVNFLHTGISPVESYTNMIAIYEKWYPRPAPPPAGYHRAGGARA